MKMASRTPRLMAALVAAAVLTTAGVALAQGWSGRPGPGGGGMGLMETFDANKDGKVTQAEIDAYRNDQLTKFDKDGNGQLNLEEYQALWADAMRQRMVRQFQAHDADGNGSVTAEEFRDRYARMVARLDRDGNGEITANELQMRGRHGRGRGGDWDRN
jgi:Ca2+-binding EF-hand superfamily protein